jgi:hypothetical protein
MHAEKLKLHGCPADALLPSHLPYGAVACYLQTTAQSASSRQVQHMASIVICCMPLSRSILSSC